MSCKDSVNDLCTSIEKGSLLCTKDNCRYWSTDLTLANDAFEELENFIGRYSNTDGEEYQSQVIEKIAEIKEKYGLEN